MKPLPGLESKYFYLNTPRIYQNSQNSLSFLSFRKNWPVNAVGKWKDDLYSALLYPEFACGSGYILTKDVVEWLYKNSEYLKRYQVSKL